MPAALTDVRGALAAWAPSHHRDLPWRRTREPWRVLVSELMLQQTQVDRVVPKYLAFVERFPTPVACADAEVSEVIRSWEGLGYNRRAVNLHRSAILVAEAHGGRIPSDLDGLLALPGVGPYTARAVLAFAFEDDVGVVDTNVARVLARVVGRRLGRREVQDLADELVPAGDAWAWNQGVLDLGATVCRARRPSCGDCPLGTHCAWFGAGAPEPDPAIGSAGVAGRQSRFEGSDRQGRGRLVDALRRGPVEDVAAAAGWPDDPERADRIARSLLADGLAVTDGDQLTLPR